MKYVSRIFIFVQVLVLVLFSVSYDALAAGHTVYLPRTTDSEPELAGTRQQVQSFNCATVTDVPPIECEALVALYSSTNGAMWRKNDGWLISPTVDSWYHVSVSDNHVIDLALSSNNLKGSIPAELGNLINLQMLSLSENQLGGVIPPELGNLSNLLLLQLFFNHLSGPIPQELGNLNSLVDLFLNDNQLSGAIPPELGNLNNLVVLHLENNQLSGVIPPEFGNLQNLEVASFYNNQLSGAIPPELGNLTTLIDLDLRNNLFSGSIPSEIGGLSNLYSLLLSSNQISDSIPFELGNLSNLSNLWLDDNSLSGTIPPELGNMTNLRRLNLASNELNGTIPSELDDLNLLFELDLSSNKLNDAIPDALGNLSNLLRLDLSSNQLTGSIPAELGSLNNLWELSLAGNKLNGSIPTAIGNLVALNHLDLSDNMFSGDVPESFTNLVNLCVTGDPNPPCYGNYKTNLGYNRLNVPAPEPPASFLGIKDPDWHLTQAVEAEIPGETGGTVTSNDGNTEIAIPAGAVEGLLTILFAPQPNPSENIGNLNFAGKSFQLTASIGETPVTSFAQPMILTLQYDQASLGPIPEDSLILYYWDANQLAWVDAASTCEGGAYTRNVDENWLSLPICHLSEFALLGDSYDLFLPAIRR